MSTEVPEIVKVVVVPSSGTSLEVSPSGVPVQVVLVPETYTNVSVASRQVAVVAPSTCVEVVDPGNEVEVNSASCLRTNPALTMGTNPKYGNNEGLKKIIFSLISVNAFACVRVCSLLLYKNL